MEAAKSSSALAACRTTMYHLSSSSSSEDELSFGANQENSVAAGPNIAVDIDNSAGVLDDSVAGVDDSSGTSPNIASETGSNGDDGQFYDDDSMDLSQNGRSNSCDKFQNSAFDTKEFADSDEDELHISSTALDDFTKYCQYANHHFCDLPPSFSAGVDLLNLLVKKRAPLHLFDDIFKWHTKNLSAKRAIPRKEMMERLNERYNTEGQKPYLLKNMTLPFSQAIVNVVCHDAKQSVVSLLTDPNIKPEDYLFHNDDPLAPPPESPTIVGDINTSRCYRETWKELIQPEPTIIDAKGVTRHKVLLMTPMYMDGAVTGQFANLPLEQMKLTLGILNCKTRDKGFAWRILGYVKNFLPEATKATDLLKHSGIRDADNYLQASDSESDEEDVVDLLETLAANQATHPALVTEDEDESEDEEEEETIPACNAQDLHTMMGGILESYKQLQEEGLDWDLPWKGKILPVHFVIRVPFVKGDTVEHDKHCGSFNSRTKGVKQLCRYCYCPTDRSDHPFEDWPRKSREDIEPLCKAGNVEALKAMSQQCIDNCWYQIKLGLHNKLGIHGACPFELLHWLQLGQYKYCRGCFFFQVGKTSIAGDSINTLAKLMGTFLKRQSERDLPRTSFSKGIIKGKLMAHEMSGVMLVLTAVLRSTAGRDVLMTQTRGKAKMKLGTFKQIKDWIMLLEKLLQLEAWLGQPELDVFLLTRLKSKIRELMQLEKRVADRDEGMKFCTFNFHAFLHLVDDILDHGVPSVVNTRSDEMHHKTSKTAALQTQRIPNNFDYQTAIRLHEYFLIELSKLELQDEKLWEYFDFDMDAEAEEDNLEAMSTESSAEGDNSVVPTALSGVRVEYSFANEGYTRSTYRVFSKMHNKHRFKFDKDLDDFLLNDCLRSMPGNNCDKYLNIFTEHTRHGKMFRGSPYFRGKPWRDWAWVEFEEEDGGDSPIQIHCFLDLRDMPEDPGDGSVHRMHCAPGIYAVCEGCKKRVDKKEVDMSEIFVPWTKIFKSTGKREFYLLDTESLEDTACLIPDHGHANKGAYLQLLPKKVWIWSFEQWLRSEDTLET